MNGYVPPYLCRENVLTVSNPKDRSERMQTCAIIASVPVARIALSRAL